jgi:ubiquinone/menaquinone biosynthesis C-methylase UbiE
MPLPSDYFDQNDSVNRCFLCENPKYLVRQHLTHFGSPLTFQQCRCGLIKQAPMPNEKFFEWFFNSETFFTSKKNQDEVIWGYDDYFSDEPSRLATSRLRFKKINKYIDIKPGSKLLKVGPATGTFLHVANQAGLQARGSDVSNRFANYARENYSVEIDIGRFEHQDYADNSFDFLILFNVIENVPNLDVFMENISRVVKPGGYFIFNHVRMDNNFVEIIQGKKYFMYRPPMCYMFAGDSLEKMLMKYRFKKIRSMLDIRYMNPEKILGLLGWRKIKRVIQVIGIGKLNFPIYAYPSSIMISRNIK